MESDSSSALILVAISPVLFDLVPLSWRGHLGGLESDLLEIETRLRGEESVGKEILPRRENIFAALEIDPKEVRVVIVGQDPYPDRRHAIGRAFAVPESVTPLPASLRNIFREKRSDVGGADPSPSLSSWQEQGVLLLNRTLTTNAGESNAHAHFGWKSVTTAIIKIAASHGAVGLLWGKSAQSLLPFFGERAIASAHPSPLSAHRGFFGSRPFSRINRILAEEIDW